MPTPLLVRSSATTVLQPSELHDQMERYAIGLEWPLMMIAVGNVSLPTNRGVMAWP
jgi:hypothetical protein